jgi:hypothetical protein
LSKFKTPFEKHHIAHIGRSLRPLKMFILSLRAKRSNQLLALIILSYAKNWEPFSSTFLIIMAGLTILYLERPQLAIFRWRLALDAHCSPKKTQFMTFRGIVTIFDYVVPEGAAKKYGAST